MNPMKAKPGDKVRFANPDAGHKSDPERAKTAGLVVDKVYTLSKVEVHGYHTDVWLEGIDGIFNSSHFETAQ